MLFTGLQVEKIHDLPKIADKFENIFPEIKQLFKNDLSTLTRYYIETRYPGDYPEFTWDECRQASEIALRVKAFVLEKVDQ